MTSFEKHIEKSDEVAMAATMRTWFSEDYPDEFIIGDADTAVISIDRYEGSEHDAKFIGFNNPATVLKQNEAMRVMMNALNKIAHTQDTAGIDPDFNRPRYEDIAESRNRRIFEAREALAKVEAIFKEGV